MNLNKRTYHAVKPMTREEMLSEIRERKIMVARNIEMLQEAKNEAIEQGYKVILCLEEATLYINDEN